MAGVVEMSSQTEIDRLYLALQDELTNLRVEVQTLRQDKISSDRRLEEFGRMVELLREEVRKGKRVEAPRIVGKGKEVVGSWRGETRVQDRGDRTGDVAGSWRVARNTATSVIIRKSQAMPGVPVTNGFNSLRDECEGGKDQEVSRKEDRMEVRSSDRRVRIETGSVVKAKGRKMFVVGDSQVRYLDRAMQSEVS